MTTYSITCNNLKGISITFTGLSEEIAVELYLMSSWAFNASDVTREDTGEVVMSRWYDDKFFTISMPIDEVISRMLKKVNEG